MKLDRNSRRMFLESAAGFCLSVPFLPSLLGRDEQAFAQQGAGLKRFVAVYSGHGHDWRDWYPTTAPSMTQLAPNIRRCNLDAFVNNGTFEFSNILSATDRNITFPGTAEPVHSAGSALWQKHMGNISIVRGLDAPHGHGDHHKGHMLSGIYDTWSDGPPYFETIDQIIIDSGRLYASTPQLASLHLHPGTTHFHTNTTSYRRSGQLVVPVPSYSKPSAAFDAALRQVVVGGNTEPLLAQIARRRSVIDFVKDDLNQLLSDPRLSGADRRRLEAHLEYMREFELKLGASPLEWDPSLGSFPPRSSAFNTDLPSVSLSASEAAHVDKNIEILAAALKIGVTQIGTLMLENGQGTHASSHDRAESAGATRQHALSVSLLQGREWTRRFLALLEALDVAEDDNSSFLDNTLIYWGSCMSTVRNHYTIDLPVILAGGKGVIDQGKYFDYRQLDTNNFFGPGTNNTPTPDGEDQSTRYYYGRAVNELLIGIMRSFGLQPADWERGGTTGFGKYSDRSAIHGLADAGNRTVYDFGDRRSALPHVFL